MIVACYFMQGLLDLAEYLWGLYSLTGFLTLTRASHVSGGQSPSFYGGGPDSLPDKAAWDFWQKKWHWDGAAFESFGFSLSLSFYQSLLYAFFRSIIHSFIILVIYVFMDRISLNQCHYFTRVFWRPFNFRAHFLYIFFSCQQQVL